MDLTELQDVQRTERQMDSLQHLSDTFYADVAEYIAERKAERRRLASTTDDPFGDPAVGRLTDEIKTAEEVVKAIYERRIGKVVKLASFDAADMKTDTAGLTSEERELFDDLVNRIITNREHVLSVLGGEGTEDSDSTSVETPASADENATQNETDESVPAEPADNKHKATVESQSQETNSHPGIPNTGAESNADADSNGDSDASPEVDIDIENQTNADSIPDSHVATEVSTDTETETETERQRSHSSGDSLPPDPDDVLAAAMGDGGDIVDATDESSVDTNTDTSDTDQSNPAINGDTTAQSTSRNPNRSNTNTDTPNNLQAQSQAPASVSELSSQSTQVDSDPHSNVNANPEVDPQPHPADSSTTPSAEPTDINRDSDNILNAQTETETETKTKTDEDSGSLERETEPEVESDLPPDTLSDDPDRVVLRITADVGRILGVDQREYDLAAEDIIMLPETNAEPLLSRDAAERLD
ncbi:DNA replication protein [Haloquadratum walsbyi]|uniref:DNA replication factor GINS n=1 Tax=Haloquadratum walsbyi (strain DSM 16790 / HBSQ001) TaxID=362976 RepID=Q18GS0_HALWD|nr:DNA replication protein [Haloquadratum walsbyi]CAJ52826.1 DNA replication factor GINS [Haloquadratum walsbyi DSM 16790]